MFKIVSLIYQVTFFAVILSRISQLPIQKLFITLIRYKLSGTKTN